MITKWIHIHEPLGDPWGLQIQKEINDAMREGRIPPSDFKNEFGLYIHTKLNMLPEIIERVEKGFKALCEKIKSCDERFISTKARICPAFDLNDQHLLYGLLIDIDSILFEIKSCDELFLKYWMRVYALMDIRDEKGTFYQRLECLIRASGKDPSWLNRLKYLRAHFAHNAAPYIAVDITESSRPKLIVMKENIIDFDGTCEERYIRLTEIGEIIDGFIDAKEILHEHLNKMVKEYDCRTG